MKINLNILKKKLKWNDTHSYLYGVIRIDEYLYLMNEYIIPMNFYEKERIHDFIKNGEIKSWIVYIYPKTKRQMEFCSTINYNQLIYPRKRVEHD